jgi:TPR repeat protein/serine/threonine protein kinase
MDTATPDSQALPPGTHLHEFVIEKVLGAGGFGITYLARDVSLNRQVVIKENLPSQFAWREASTGTVRPRHSTGGDMDDFEWSMKNFLRESETLASLDHPGIVRVLRQFSANGTAYFVMPYVDGLALDTLIEDRRKKDNPFSEEELRGLLDRMLDALAYLHDRGIYHRDIKPGNILISNDGVPALIDFGAARQRLSERSMTVIESAGYTPFEQLQSHGNIGPWSDLYALGATLVKAITSETLPKAADRVMKDPWFGLANHPTAISRHSFPLLDSIDRAVQVTPGNRWQDAREWQIGLRDGTKFVPLPTAAVLPPSAPAYPTPPLHEDFSASSRLDQNNETAHPVEVAAPALWNPTTAVNLGVILTPAFGAFLHARNYKALGRPADAKSGMYWFYGMAACGFIGMLFTSPLSYFKVTNFFFLILWYFISAKKQIKLVESKFGKNYTKKSFIKPLFAGIGCLFAVVIFVEGLHSLGRDESIPVSAGEASRVDAGAVNEKAEDAVSLFNRGIAYANGDGVTQDLAEAVRYYQKAADLGHLDAMNNLGLCYENGTGVAKDEEEAVKWYRKAAEAGNVYGIYNLGLCYDNGTGVAKNEEEAAKWFRLAAEQGDADAQNSIGVCYQYGMGVTKDASTAVSWYRKAADQGNAVAQRNLGDCYWKGDGVTEDDAEAVKWFRLAAEQGDADAQNNLGVFHQYGIGVTKDASTAVSWYRKAADQGNAVAQRNLGNCYYYGDGLTKDAAEAVKWYRKAVDQGDALAQNALGDCYRSGEGLVKDATEAAKWYKKSADQGNNTAQFNLGYLHATGEGVPKDLVLAYKWWNLSAVSGDTASKDNLEKISKQMTSEQIAEAQRLCREWQADHQE